MGFPLALRCSALAESCPWMPPQTKDTGVMFNVAKTLGILGRVKESDEAYSEVAHASLGRDLTVCWGTGRQGGYNAGIPAARKDMRLNIVSPLLYHSHSPRLLLQWII